MDVMLIGALLPGLFVCGFLWRIAWIYIGLGCVWLLEPGRLVDKDRGLWTLRREFESRPGYHVHLALSVLWFVLGGCGCCARTVSNSFA